MSDKHEPDFELDMRRHAGGLWEIHQGKTPDDTLDLLSDANGEIDCAVCGETWLHYWGETHTVAIRIEDEIICANCILGLLDAEE